MTTPKTTDQVNVDEIIVPEEVRFPEFANAFRLMPETGGDCIVEFLIFMAAEGKAKVVSRVRVRNDFLLTIRNSINNSLPSQHQQPVVHSSGQITTPDGSGVMVFQHKVGSKEGD